MCWSIAFRPPPDRRFEYAKGAMWKRRRVAESSIYEYEEGRRGAWTGEVEQGCWACADVPVLSRYYERWCLRRRYVIRGPQYFRKKTKRGLAENSVKRLDFSRRRGRCYNFRRWTPEPSRGLWRWGYTEGWNSDHPRCMGGHDRLAGRQSKRQEALQHRCHGHSSAKEGYDRFTA